MCSKIELQKSYEDLMSEVVNIKILYRDIKVRKVLILENVNAKLNIFMDKYSCFLDHLTDTISSLLGREDMDILEQSILNAILIRFNTFQDIVNDSLISLDKAIKENTSTTGHPKYACMKPYIMDLMSFMFSDYVKGLLTDIKTISKD